MPIEREERGRGYTKRSYLRVERELTDEEVRQLDRATEALRRAVSLEGKLAESVRAAEFQLTRSGLPLDPYDTLYSDDWMRQHERRSLTWYAVQILRTILLWRDHLQQDDEEGAMAECFVLGALVTEAGMVAHMVGGQSRGGDGAKVSDHRHEIEQERADWLVKARELRQRHPSWSARRVATRLDPARPESVRKAIAPLWKC